MKNKSPFRSPYFIRLVEMECEDNGYEYVKSELTNGTMPEPWFYKEFFSEVDKLISDGFTVKQAFAKKKDEARKYMENIYQENLLIWLGL